MRRHLTYANVVATLALLLALGGGTAYAAAKLAAGSVGSAQLRSNSVTSAKVRNGSLLAKDFKGGQLTAGPRGATGSAGAVGAVGSAGATGAIGPAGSNGAVGPAGAKGDACLPSVAACKGPKGDQGAPVSFYTRLAGITTPPKTSGNGVGIGTASCNPGDVATGGGFDQNAPGVGGQHPVWSKPSDDGAGWTVRLDNDASSSYTGLVYVVCADLP